MKKGLLAAISVASIIALAGLATAAQSVRILPNTDGQFAGFHIQANGPSSTNVSLNIPAIALSTVELNSREYKKIELPAADYLSSAEIAEEGKPSVPGLTTMMIIPDQAGVRLTVTYSGYDDIEDVDLAPVQPPASEANPNAVIPFTRDDNAYSQDTFYPGQLAEAADPVIMRDIRAVQISMYPAQYNPVRRTLRVYRDLSVAVSYDGEVVNPKTTRRPYLSDGFYPIYKAMFANFEEVFGTMEVKRGTYVIICKAALADSLKPLALWKHKKGYATRIVRTTEINSSGTPTYTQIFDYLRTAYQTWDVPPEYVMLVGDVSGTYGVAHYPFSGFASDHHYTCVDGTDYLPDIFVARLSVNQMPDFRKAVAKILKYEEWPLMRDPDHWIRGLGVGYTYYESARFITLWVRHKMLESGFARVDTIYGQMYDGRLMTYFNSGPGFIFYRGAGGTDGWAGPAFGISDLNAMQTTNKLGVLSPLTCGTGDFGQECFGETWIRMGVNTDSLKGGPAFYGVSDHNTHTQWNNPIMVGYFFGIFGHNVYHFSPAAVMGKLQDYRTFPRHLNDEVRQYFHTYNMLGDPELELRTKIPIMLTVTHPETLALGLNHIDINVIDTSGHVIKDAFVTLIKMVDTTEELYSLGKTDESGNISLTFNALTPGSIFLTVSGQNLYPYEGLIQIVSSDVAVGFDSLAIDDDSYGFSHGDDNRLASPGETVELGIKFKNFGTALTANNIVANITAIDTDMVDILDASSEIGSLAPGESRMIESVFAIRVRNDAQDNDLIRLRQAVTDLDNHAWLSTIEIPVKAPKFVISHIAVLDSNNRLDPGETVNMVLTLINRGQLGAPGVNGSITTQDDYTVVRSANGTFGDMPIGDTSSNDSSPMIVSIGVDAFSGRTVNFNLYTTTAVGASSSIPFSIKVDSVIHNNDPTGPDAYGYYAYDKNDTLYAPHPSYGWVELVPGLGGSGTRVNFGGDGDDKSVMTQLPFDFVYYGQAYRALIIGTNGFVSPDTSHYDQAGHYWDYFFNWPIPDPGNARAQISPFWDDLQVTSSGNYGVFTWNDTTNHRFVIEWNHVSNIHGSGYDTFELIIKDPEYYPTLTGDAEILFQYNVIYNNDSQFNYATVGCESRDELTGVQYSFDNQPIPGSTPLANGLAVLLTTNTGRGGIKGQATAEGISNYSGIKVSASTGQNRITDTSGGYWLRDVSPGQVSLKGELSGYFPAFRDSIVVTANTFLSGIDFNLSRCPVPADLTASDTLSGLIQIYWDGIIHSHLAGYNIYRSRFQNGGFVKLNDGLLFYPYYSDQVTDTLLYWYEVTAVFADGNWTAESFLSGAVSGQMRGGVGIAGEGSAIPKEYFLSQNYPNPFNPTTTISYGLPRDANVKVDVFNLLGQRVISLVDEPQKAGYSNIIWDGKDNSGKAVSSGVYFYRIEAGTFKDSKKMLMLK